MHTTPSPKEKEKTTLAFWTTWPLFSSFMPTVDVKTSVQFCKQKIIKTAITIIMYMEWLLAWDNGILTLLSGQSIVLQNLRDCDNYCDCCNDIKYVKNFSKYDNS